MKRWIWVIVAVCVSTAVYFTIRYGLRPKAIPVMNATEFENFEQIGIVIYKRLRIDIRSERLLVLGGSTAEEAGIWQGLVKAAQADRERTVVSFDAAAEGDKILETVQANLKPGQLVVVTGRTQEVSHLVEGNLSKRLEKTAGHRVMAISTMPLVLKTEEIDNLQTQCLDTSESAASMRKLECAAQKVARKNLKKKLDPAKIWAAMEQHGFKEYLVFIHRP